LYFSKSREWERERRERLNNSFNDLSKILPTSDNKAITKKMEILQKATTFIKALQEENAELLESGGLEKSWCKLSYFKISYVQIILRF
jgi:hypothetical protein